MEKILNKSVFTHSIDFGIDEDESIESAVVLGQKKDSSSSSALMSVLCIFSLLFWFINTVIHPRRIPALHFLSSPSICLAFPNHCHHLSPIPQVHLQFSFSFTVSSPTAFLPPSGNFSTLFLCCVCPWGHGGILPSATAKNLTIHSCTCTYMYACVHTYWIDERSTQDYVGSTSSLCFWSSLEGITALRSLYDQLLMRTLSYQALHWQQLYLNC